LRDDETSLPRTFGFIGGTMALVGTMAIGFHIYNNAAQISLPWAIFLVAAGFCGMLFHAAFDRDIQVRRGYLILGLIILTAGIGLGVAPGYFKYSVPGALVALLFLLAFLRTETSEELRTLVQVLIGGLGAALAVLGLFGGVLRGDFFLPIGMICSLVGLLYLTAFVGSRGVSDDWGYYAAWKMIIEGTVLCLYCCIFGALLRGSVWFTSYGILLTLVGGLYTITGLVMAVDWPIFVLLRRELGAFFYSPIAYLTMIGFTLVSWISFFLFLTGLARSGGIEPIVTAYILSWWMIIPLLAVVPILTMRLLSEEHRSGTLEVLLTAPVDESTVVLAKFFASLITYLVLWLPYGLYLLAIPLAGGNFFDYRPLVSLFVAILASGAMFMSMGLFFSSLTKNQVASGVLSFAGMLGLTVIFFAREAPAFGLLVRHTSYIELWQTLLEGKIVVKLLLFPLSLTVVLLFVTIKVLESRKWR
jgi:ABC-type transport system involved in multi-copper enzyme maturation permease subunit